MGILYLSFHWGLIILLQKFRVILSFIKDLGVLFVINIQTEIFFWTHLIFQSWFRSVEAKFDYYFILFFSMGSYKST